MNGYYAGQVVEYNDPHEALLAFVHGTLMPRYDALKILRTPNHFTGFTCPEGYDLVATDHNQIACAYRRKSPCLGGYTNELGAFVCSDWDYPPCPSGMSPGAGAGSPKNWCFPHSAHESLAMHYVGDDTPRDWSALGHGCPMGYYYAPLEGTCRPIPPQHFTGGGDGGLSFEDAWAHAEQHANIGQQSGPDPIEQIRAKLSQAGATIVSACAPDTMSVVIKAAIQNGHAAGVSVYTVPPSPTVSACVARQVRALRFPASGFMDAVTASF